MSKKWKNHLSLVQCTTPEHLCDQYDNDRIRRWVDKASEKLSKAINEDLGDDMDLIQPEHLGSCLKAVSTQDETIIQLNEVPEEVADLIKGIEEQIKETRSHL